MNDQNISPVAAIRYWRPSSMNVCGALRDPADARVPQRLAGGRIVRHQVARAVAREQQAARRGQQSAAAAVAIVGMPPRDLAGLVIDRRQEAPARADADFFFAAQPHRSARIHVGQIEDRIIVALRGVEQAGIRRVGGRLPIDGAVRRSARPASRAPSRSLAGSCCGPPNLFRPLAQLVDSPVLAGHQVLAGDAIQREVVAVARRRQHQLPHLAVEHRRPPAPAFARNRSRACRAARSGNTRPSCRCPRSPRPASR